MKILNIILLSLIIGIPVFTAILCSGFPHYNTYPEIMMDASDTSTTIAAIEFPFKDDIVQGDVTLSLAPYNGTKYGNANKASLFGGFDDNAWKEDYYLAITEDPAQEQMYCALLAFFDEYAAEHDLTSDEYVELLTTYVQDIPYKTADLTTKFPIETVIENWGDCDDKSVLLAGLLSEKGYDTGVIYFDQDNHMTAAIKGWADTAYGNTGYTIIETTRYAYIGEEPELILNQTSGNYSFFTVGEGTKSYTASYQIETILDTRNEAYITAQTIYDEMSALLSEIEREEILLKESWSEPLYLEYKENLKIYNAGVTTRNEYIGLISTINSGSNNREKIYETVISIR